MEVKGTMTRKQPYKQRKPRHTSPAPRQQGGAPVIHGGKGHQRNTNYGRSAFHLGIRCELRPRTRTGRSPPLPGTASRDCPLRTFFFTEPARLSANPFSGNPPAIDRAARKTLVPQASIRRAQIYFNLPLPKRNFAAHNSPPFAAQAAEGGNENLLHEVLTFPESPL